jgi:betaine reductase
VLVARVRDEHQAEMIVAGPAFTSGRYGLACARVAAAASEAGLPAMAAMHPENPGLGEAAGTVVVESGATSRHMRDSLDRLADATRKVAAGEELTAQDGRIGPVARTNRLAERSAAERAVALVLARLGGDREATEIPLPDFDQVTPAAPVDDPAEAVFALVTEGGFVPAGNPDRLESARASKWVRYSLDGLDSAEAGTFESVHGGFSTQWANADPNRILPLDVARELEREGAIARLHGEYLATTGNGTTVADARRFGMEWAAELRQAGIQAAILTAT